MTLVEMLVVLAVIGVSAGAVTLGIGAATRAPSVESEARRFANQVEAAADDAMLGDRMVALTVDDSGYGFVKVASDGSVPQGTPKLAWHTLPGGVAMTLDQRPPLVLGIDGVSKPLVATLVAGAQTWVVRYDGLTATVARADATGSRTP
ncbi:prepilin-type N-terminal cleavage/methylation domain-containing protein [Sphingomonas sp. RS2018]